MHFKILIADDNESIRQKLLSFLESRMDCQICAEAEDGREAVITTVATKPDLAILDLAMPVMNGLQAALKIRRLIPGVAVLIYTFHVCTRVQSEALKAGISRVISKADPGGLLAAIETALTERIPTRAMPRLRRCKKALRGPLKSKKKNEEAKEARFVGKRSQY